MRVAKSNYYAYATVAYTLCIMLSILTLGISWQILTSTTGTDLIPATWVRFFLAQLSWGVSVILFFAPLAIHDEIGRLFEQWKREECTQNTSDKLQWRWLKHGPRREILSRDQVLERLYSQAEMAPRPRDL
ncbi:hypothetical protein BDV96DRAFT_654506 [Lophiotrema nucula]|uniref:Uncharacterized protein n=1 Tax=Lophiotrema nucula TaxID=690887 RepID=A0A6A5YI57_9PLEO|nr:hypothetical protein BDV96DRAFT_654506 [Lophiotrema nucula]